MKRRKFLKILASISLIPFLPDLSFFSTNLYEKSNYMIPKKLEKNSKIGLIAPGSFIKKEQLAKAVKTVEELGFSAYYTDNILKKYGYFAGDDQTRADELMKMFSDPTVDAILCVRGGYGCTRLLPLIDYDIIKKNPKALIGFSDVTALQYAIYKKTGLITFHGTVGISTFNDYTTKCFKNTLMISQENYTIEYERDENTNSKSEHDIYSIIEGEAEGILIGGNLSLMVSLIGTEYDVDYTDKLVFIEEIDEYPYKIDRMLTQLIHATNINKAAGIVMGVFDKCEPDGIDVKKEDSLSLKEIISDRFGSFQIPVLYGFSFGHVENKCIFPVGINAKLNTKNQTVELLEAPVF
jgi:muramoyltetrapeptide carboxypeptidase